MSDSLTPVAAVAEGVSANQRTTAWVRWAAYFRERFPLVAYGILIASFYSSNQFLAHVLTQPKTPLSYDLTTVAGCIVILCIFFHLRIFDDHKDYSDDCVHWPERVLQRGVVTLGELKMLAAGALVVEFALAAARGLGAVVAVMAAIGFTYLMYKEFFVARWLKRHFLLYASTHMLLMPLLALVVFSFATAMAPWHATGWYWVYASVSFFVAFNWEISRKIYVPAQERAGVDSYSKVFGTYAAAYIVLAVRVIDTALVMLVAWHLGLALWFYVALVLLFVVCAAGVLRFRLWPSPATAKQLGTYAGIYIVAFDLLLAIELARKCGVVFQWFPGVHG